MMLADMGAEVIRLDRLGGDKDTPEVSPLLDLELWKFSGARLREITPYYWDTHALAVTDRPPS